VYISGSPIFATEKQRLADGGAGDQHRHQDDAVDRLAGARVDRVDDQRGAMPLHEWSVAVSNSLPNLFDVFVSRAIGAVQRVTEQVAGEQREAGERRLSDDDKVDAENAAQQVHQREQVLYPKGSDVPAHFFAQDYAASVVRPPLRGDTSPTRAWYVAPRHGRALRNDVRGEADPGGEVRRGGRRGEPRHRARRRDPAALVDRATAYAWLERYPEAVRDLEAALALTRRRACSRQKWSTTLTSVRLLGAGQGRRPTSIEAAERTLARYKTVLPDGRHLRRRAMA
jgi:hypothetical protein